jgi:CPA2 family monovalent cation:H+ antiporter-2
MAYGFFVPIFFIHVGMRLDISLGMLTRNMGDILLLIVIMFVVKFLPGLHMMMKGLKFKEVLATCSLLAAPLTLVIAIMELGLHNPEKTGITPEVSAKMIAAGIFASLLYPSLARKLLKSDVPDMDKTMDTHESVHAH